MNIYRLIIIVFTLLYIFGCSEKTTYYGKIITEDDLTKLNIQNKKQLLEKFGKPSYIDTILNKYFYYTEKNKSKNFYINNIEYSYLFVFELDQENNVTDSVSINLLNNKNKLFINKETKNNIIERGLIEKVFGGVGPNQLPDSQ